KLRDMQVDYHREKSKLEALSNLTERYEGYGGSVKKVMEQKDTEKGIVGVVADIVKVEKKYEVAIETALGGNIQNIVTEDEATAKHMIAYLKQTKGGRATFLPLTSITNPQEFKTPEALDEEGVLGLADSLVKTDKKYANVAKAMVGRIMVVDTVDHALKIARKYDYGIRMVTLEGELLVPGGAISGGTFKNNSNLLGRRREMDELENKVKQFLKDIDDVLSDIEKTKEERNNLRIELEKTKAAIQERSIAQNTARLNVISAEEKWNETEEGYGNLQDEQADIERRIKEAGDEKEEILAQLAESEALEKTTESEIVEFQSELEVHKGEETDKLKKVSEWDVELEKYRQQQAFKQQNIDRIDGEIGRLQAELSEIEQGITAGEEDIAAKEHDITEIEKTILESHTTKSDTEEKLRSDMQQKEELAERQKSFFERREELATRQTDLDKEVYRLQAQKERLESSIEAKINYMWDEYEITLSDAAAMRDESMNDLSAMKKEISSLKDQIRKLGDVNVNAIEDYKNLMERYTFLKGQHDDLIQAEETLQGIIAELDSAMRKQFDENFAKIKQEFDKVFKELFGGGKGTVELMEDEDILEAGIRIIAQPPGKKLQNMMQLSGGEKALTAIALLFAIQNLKPSPFCLLDEIEAALDESNVGRFAKYLHKLTKNTQFIVITHRRGTMERADRLYGITMQEKGISTLVSVNLIDDQLDS
ncbi:MAG: chromosome segregation protein SMC, partial [Lachnospiraceae bacterium]|nr:chromosome segregation protein SMC [Lachnospiraceae bacterium]